MPSPATEAPGPESAVAAARPVKWAKIIDHTRCVGCHACTVACKSENEVPLGVTRTYVKSVDVGVFPHARRAFQVTRCNQCDAAPCVTACPTGAMWARRDGIVDFDKSICIGCKACIAACPYDAIFINPDDHAAEKCNFCAHRLDVGLEPACVVVCPTEAILVGDLNDPHSRVAQLVHREPVTVRRPEKDTRPKLFYQGAHQATLDPLAARRPDGGLYMWSEQGDGVASGVPAPWNNTSAAALLSYDIPHEAPWHWRVSLYTWTKAIAAGVYLVLVALALRGAVSWTGALWLWAAPLVGGAFLAATGVLLIADLKHPERFYMIFTRPQWRSWLVRGAFIIAGYAVVLVLHFIGALAGWPALPEALAWPGIVLAGLTAVYTAYLFAQAKARDLWQNPLLPLHFLVQALVAGAAALIPLAAYLDAASVRPLVEIVASGIAVHLLLVWSEAALPHATAHARLAAREMTAGRYRAPFWWGVGLGALALAAAAGALLILHACVQPQASAAPLGCDGGSAGGLTGAAALFALACLLLYEHAYVEAGQCVPLA